MRDALERLKEGNKKYLTAKTCAGDASCEARLYTSEHGQKPYAVVVCCSDSRVIPEFIFSAGIGELFVIRVAGNVVGNVQLGSIEYAVRHLNSKLVVVMGHTGCGAVGAAMQKNGGFVKFITDEIRFAAGVETDPYKASVLNVKRGVAEIERRIKVDGMRVVGAMYDTASGEVDFNLQ